MVAVFSAPDVTLIVTLFTVAVAYLRDRHKVAKKADAAASTADEVAKQFTNNGGTTMRDQTDRIEQAVSELTTKMTTLTEKVDTEVVPRLDHGATVMATFADRLAVVEARPTNNRTRRDDH